MTTTPFDSIRIYVLWAPPGGGNEGPGMQVAMALNDSLSGSASKRDTAGLGITVRHRSRQWPNKQGVSTFRPIDFDAAECNVIIAVYTDVMHGRDEWRDYLRQIYKTYEQRGGVDLLLPIILSKVPGARPSWGQVQGIARDEYLSTDGKGLSPSGLRRLILDVLSRILEKVRPNTAADQPKKVTIFLSHAKQDGVDAATLVEQFGRLKPSSGVPGVGLFYDVAHTLTGANFDEQFLGAIKECVFLAIVTDAYHGRPWCQWELLRAKQWQRPIVVWDRTDEGTARSFPYLGNVPVVRTPNLDGASDDLVENLLIQVLVEAIRMQVWENDARRRMSAIAGSRYDKVAYFARPPELADIAYQCRAREISVIVYPDPPIGKDERSLFEAVLPGVLLLSLGEVQQ
ncbi:MAG TPA: toll/interleukin-1 receptor domain-containing protein [Steroidobacteraceae bacterium]|jgi:hypothetical protein